MLKPTSTMKEMASPEPAASVTAPITVLPQSKETDITDRAKLGDSGLRVVVIRYDRDLTEQVAEYPDIFGPGIKSVSAS